MPDAMRCNANKEKGTTRGGQSVDVWQSCVEDKGFATQFNTDKKRRLGLKYDDVIVSASVCVSISCCNLEPMVWLLGWRVGWIRRR